jgi:hypothetical protein
MRRGVVIAVVLSAATLAAPSGAAGEVTHEDRAFAAAVKAFDAATLTATHDPAVLDAIRARQQAATTCLDAARGIRRNASAFLGAMFYTLHVLAPFAATLAPAADRYAHTLRSLRLRNPVLRSARAVQLLSVRSVGDFARTDPDFCGPLSAWQAARFDAHAIPAPIDAAVAAFRRAPAFDDQHAAKLRRASVRLRAAGVRLAVRERFVGKRDPLNTDAIFKDDQMLAALDVGVSSP